MEMRYRAMFGQSGSKVKNAYDDRELKGWMRFLFMTA